MSVMRTADGDVTSGHARPPFVLGGYAALAESAWMGFAQATEILEPLRALPAAVRRWQVVVPRLPRIQVRGLTTREFTVAEASFILMASFFTSAMLGAVRQVLFNAQFGVGMDADAYYAAFRLPDTLFSLVAGGALSSAMIPVLLGASRDDGESAALRLTNLVLTTLVAVMAVVVVVVAVFTPFLVRNVLAPGFDPETSRLAASLTRVMLAQPLILAAGSVITAVLNARNRFLFTGLSVASHNLALIGGIAASRLYPELGIYGPTFGVVVGSVLNVVILLPGLRGLGFRLGVAWDLFDRRLREVVRLLIPNGLSVGVNYAGFIVDTAYATKAPEAAALPAIYNAFLLVGLPIALLGQAVGQAAFPRLAAHAEANRWRDMRRSLLQSIAAAIALSLPALVALLILGRPTIRLLFERGRFDATAGDLTYAVLVAYAVALPAYVATEVVTRGLIALRDTRTSLVTNTAQLIGRAVIIAMLLGRLGVVAVPVAFAVTATLETLILTPLLWFKLRERLRAAAV